VAGFELHIVPAREYCLRYLSLQLLGGIPGDVSVPIWSFDANAVLARERAAYGPCCPGDLGFAGDTATLQATPKFG
jgi:hypothetical protein